jgi:hypothetical protein
MDNTELLKAMKEMTDANQEKVDTNMKTNHEMLAKMEARKQRGERKIALCFSCCMCL